MGSGASMTITSCPSFGALLSCVVSVRVSVQSPNLLTLTRTSRIQGHKYIKPKSIHDTDIVDEYAKHYMYLACIKFINSVRQGTHGALWDNNY